jgi:phosphoribosylglycinamide formyltransferase-1
VARAVVMASGRGSNFQAVAERLADSRHVIEALICDRATAGVIDRAKLLHIRTVVVDYRKGRREAEQEIASILEELNPDLVVLAGFMKILPEFIVAQCAGHIVNIHPALLPKYPGTHAIERSYESNDTELGISIHFVDAGVDTGPVIAQRSFRRSGEEKLEEIEKRIHELEHELYPEIVLSLLDTVESEANQPTGATL